MTRLEKLIHRTEQLKEEREKLVVKDYDTKQKAKRMDKEISDADKLIFKESEKTRFVYRGRSYG